MGYVEEVQIGIERLQAGSLDEAIAKFQECMDGTERDSALWNNIGIAYYRKGMPKKAMGAFKKSFELDEDQEEALCNLIALYERRKEYENAINCLNFWVGKDSTNLAAFSKKIKLEKKLLKVRVNQYGLRKVDDENHKRAELNLKMGNMEKALNLFKSSELEHPENTIALQHIIQIEQDYYKKLTSKAPFSERLTNVLHPYKFQLMKVFMVLFLSIAVLSLAFFAIAGDDFDDFGPLFEHVNAGVFLLSMIAIPFTIGLVLLLWSVRSHKDFRARI